MTFGEQVRSFYKNLDIKAQLPKGVVVLNPYHDDEAFSYCSQFYNKFYGDSNERTIIFGINPGRHGGGMTGIPFTDPIKLENYCGIPNPFIKKPELSADFIYTMIAAYGGPEKFYGQFFFSAVSPLGFTMEGKNLNYYDIKDLQIALKDFIVNSMTQQLSFGVKKTVCFCLGEGENFKFLQRLNAETGIFQEVIPLAHPRFIMQYKRKKIAEYVDRYLATLNAKP